MQDRFLKKNPTCAFQFSDGFKKLIFNLLSYEPDERMSISELRHNYWLNDFTKSKVRKDLAIKYHDIIQEKNA